MPLGPGQPAALLEALGEREDWEELRIGTARCSSSSPPLFNHPNVHYLSGFFGPIERVLRDSGANISFAPADFRRFEPILEDQAPRVMATAAAPPDADGWCSLSLHAGSTYREMLRIAERPGSPADRRGLGPLSANAGPRAGLPPRAAHRPDRRPGGERPAPLPLEDPHAGEAERAIAEHARRYIPRRRDPPDGHRRDPLDDRGPAGRRAMAGTTGSTPRCSPPG